MTTLLERLGVRLPIIQAPMAGTSTPALAAAVTNAGGLGSIGVGAVNAAGARAMIDELKSLTSGPFNVNVFCHRPAAANPDRERDWLMALKPVFARYGAEPPSTLKEIYTSFVADAAMLDVFVQTRPAVVSFHFGLPSAGVIAKLKAAGIVLFSSATNLHEAEAAVKAGVDAIVAQGFEAGGHRGVFDPDAPDSRIRALSLTKLLVEKIALPVIAAGGIMDGAGIAAALDAGAQAAQLGTAFVGCPESSADKYYRDAFFAPNATTQMTQLISGRPARCLQNKFTALKDGELKRLTTPGYPATYDAGKALAIAAKAKGEGGFGAQWAGEGVAKARAMPAAELVKVLADELTAATGKAAAVSRA